MSVNMYYLSSHTHESSDTMLLITEPLENKYLEKTKLEERQTLEEREVEDSAPATFLLCNLVKVSQPL